jgi:hypothetical protein
MAAAGYDPNNLFTYVRRVQPERAAALVPLSVRLNNLAQAIAMSSVRNPRAFDTGFSTVQDEVRRQLAFSPALKQARRTPSLVHPDR